MNRNLRLAPTPHVIQLPVSLESPIQPLDGDAAVVHQLPLGGLGCLGNQLLVSWVWVDDGLGMVLVLDGDPQLLAGVGFVADTLWTRQITAPSVGPAARLQDRGDSAVGWCSGEPK